MFLEYSMTVQFGSRFTSVNTEKILQKRYLVFIMGWPFHLGHSSQVLIGDLPQNDTLTLIVSNVFAVQLRQMTRFNLWPEQG